MIELINAVLNVMEDCQWIEKSLNVWTWLHSYKWVSDKDVKMKIWSSMRKHWLVIFPTDIVPIKVEKSEWEETYKDETKTKRSYFTEVITKYMLYHKSWASVQLAWYWQWVDTQDKWAGKSTTYALKYTLLYTFLVATWHIDDTDTVNSEEIEIAKPQFWLVNYNKLVTNKNKYNNCDEALQEIIKHYSINLDFETKIRKLFNPKQ